MATTYDVFLSLRFCEAEHAGQAIKLALQQRGLSVFLCRESPGDDMTKAIIDALHECKMAVILGTEAYGRRTNVSFSTYQELRYIMSRNKPFFLVKMCHDFVEREARFRLTEDIMHYPWQPEQSTANVDVPSDLVDQIVAKLEVRTKAIVQTEAAEGEAPCRVCLLMLLEIEKPGEEGDGLLQDAVAPAFFWSLLISCSPSPTVSSKIHSG